LACRVEQDFDERLQNVARVVRRAGKAGWAPLPAALPTGIVMLRANCPTVRHASPDSVRRFFVSHGVSVSSYEEGIVRLAMPERPLSDRALDLLEEVLRQCAELPIGAFEQARFGRRRDDRRKAPLARMYRIVEGPGVQRKLTPPLFRGGQVVLIK
jgi:hypothetical protein